MIEIRLFGDLQRYAAVPAARSGVVVNLPSKEGGTLGQLLARLGIDPTEVGNVFLNGRVVPRSTYPITLGYPLAASQPLTAEGTLNVEVSPGDRLAIFARNMSVLVV